MLNRKPATRAELSARTSAARWLVGVSAARHRPQELPGTIMGNPRLLVVAEEGAMITPDDRRVLDILAQNPDGATDRSLSTAGVSRDLLERLVYAGYLRQQAQLFAR